jgi:hypothetical protein
VLVRTPNTAAWIAVFTLALLGAYRVPACAQDKSAEPFYEIETKYIFGFTEGATIGLEGEKEISAETVARLGKRDGRYAATQTKLEFEHTPSQFVQVEFGALVSSHDIKAVTDLDDRHAVNLMGAFGELRYLVIGRGPSSPVGVTVSIEPVWRRIDETGGQRVTNYELETKLHIDTELVENRVYAAVNAMYEPEWTRTSEGELERESTVGVSSAISFRFTPPLLIGMELGYYRHYDGIGLNVYTGDALFVGPTLYYQLTRKSFVTAAFGEQVAGRAVGDPRPLNLAEFSRHRAKFKVAVEF